MYTYNVQNFQKVQHLCWEYGAQLMCPMCIVLSSVYIIILMSCITFQLNVKLVHLVQNFKTVFFISNDLV